MEGLLKGKLCHYVRPVVPACNTVHLWVHWLSTDTLNVKESHNSDGGKDNERDKCRIVVEVNSKGSFVSY